MKTLCSQSCYTGLQIHATCLVKISEHGGLWMKDALLQDRCHKSRHCAAARQLPWVPWSGFPVRQNGEVLRPNQAYETWDHPSLQQQLVPEQV